MVCLIDVRAVWVAVGGSGEPPFTVSMPDQASCWRLSVGCGCGWVEHFCCLSECSGCDDRCSGCDDWVELGTLLGPEETPAGGGGFLGAIPGWVV
jgi:hypothetical protein